MPVRKKYTLWRTPTDLSRITKNDALPIPLRDFINSRKFSPDFTFNSKCTNESVVGPFDGMSAPPHSDTQLINNSANCSRPTTLARTYLNLGAVTVSNVATEPSNSAALISNSSQYTTEWDGFWAESGLLCLVERFEAKRLHLYVSNSKLYITT